MSATHVVVEGTLKADGTLELDSKLNLPPGRVQLIVQPLPELPKDDPFWQMMQRIWAARAAAGLSRAAPRKSKRDVGCFARMWKKKSRKPGGCKMRVGLLS